VYQITPRITGKRKYTLQIKSAIKKVKQKISESSEDDNDMDTTVGMVQKNCQLMWNC
jgi:hypothetical protein